MKFKRNSEHSINSYSDLRNFFRLINFNERNKEIGGEKVELSDFAKVGIGCVLLSGSIKNINYFSTNRYLLDAVNAKQIPEFSALNSDYFVNEIIDYFKLPKINDLKCFDSQWSETVKNLIKKINKNEAFITKKFWNNKRKDYFNKNGFIIIPNFIEKDKIEFYRKKIYELAEIEKKKGKAYLYGFGNKGQRVYNLINKTNVFDNLLKDTRLKEMLDDIFYRNTYHQLYTISSMQANILEPGALAQKLHCDASVPNPLPPWIVRANIGFAVEDFNFKNGGTRFIPGSHLKLRHPTETDYEENKDKIISLDAPKGSMILWHGHVWHQSGENNSQEKRAGIFVAYCATYLLEVSLEENHPLVISKKRKLKLSDELMDLFALNHGIKKK